MSTTPQSAARFRSFAAFFKGYMGVSSLVVAALPIPVSAFDLIPTFSAQTKYMGVYTSLFCFLLFGFVFYLRHTLARFMFPRFVRVSDGKILKSTMIVNFLITLAPLLFIVMSLASVGGYHYYLNSAVERLDNLDWLVSDLRPVSALLEGESKFDYILRSAGDEDISFSERILACYLAIFLNAELAFILMATREFLQDLIGVSDMELVMRRRTDVKD